MKRALLAALALAALAGCENDASVASYNISKAADQFEIVRRVVFYNGITGEYMLEVTGNCSIKADRADNQLELTCALGNGQFKKHYLGLSDNVTYFVEQVKQAKASVSHYRVVFKPSVIVPAIELR